MIGLGGGWHAHVCPTCMVEEKPGDSRLIYPCTKCTEERDMMKPKLCSKHSGSDPDPIVGRLRHLVFAGIWLNVLYPGNTPIGN